MSKKKTKKVQFFPHPRPIYPWVILGLSIFFQFYKDLLLVTPSIMIPDLFKAFPLNGEKMGLVMGMPYYVYFLFQIPCGLLIDRHGARRITSLGVLFSALGIILYGMSPTLEWLYCGRILIGLGISVAVVNITKIIANWFEPKLFALLFGTTIAAGMLGAAAGQVYVHHLVTLFGWRTAMLDIGVFGVIFAAIFFIIVRDNAPGAQYDINPKLQRLRLSMTFWRMLKRKETWILALFTVFALTPFTLFGGIWGIPFIRVMCDFTLKEATIAQSVLFISTALTAPVIGYISTKLKKRKIFLIVASCIGTISTFLIIFFPFVPLGLMVVNLIIFGASYGVFVLSFVLMREFNVSKIAATSIGFINSFYALFAAFGDQFVGRFIQFEWSKSFKQPVPIMSPESLQYALLYLPFFLGLSFAISFLVKETHAKQKLKEELNT